MIVSNLGIQSMSQFCFCSPDHLFICSEMSSSSWECQELRSVYYFVPSIELPCSCFDLFPKDQKHKDFFFAVSCAEPFSVALLRKLLEVHVSCGAEGTGLTFVALYLFTSILLKVQGEKRGMEKYKNYVQLQVS